MLNSNVNGRPMGSLHVAELARRAQVTPATIRYYSRVGLLSPDRQPDNGYRCFSAGDLRRVVFIRQAQALGLTISDINAVLETVEKGETTCHQVRALVEQKLVSVRDRIAELRVTEGRISQAIAIWDEMPDVVPTDDEFCPLIERLDLENGNVSYLTRKTGRDRRAPFDCDHVIEISAGAYS